MSQTRLIAGAMSGTSADGVDVAIARVTGCGLGMRAELAGHHHVKYGDDLRRAILAVRREGMTTLAELAGMGGRISRAYVDCIRGACAELGMKPAALAAVAAHGQTLYHAPPQTIQWLDPALIAAELGCPVVSDFRRADCAAGGQGAPLVPFADYLLFRDATRNRVLLNIGGIANVTLLSAGGSIEQVVAFDTGPGNCISDYLMRDRGGVDNAGELAMRGRADERVVEAALQAGYFSQDPPKSTDGPAMLAIFEKASAGAGRLSLEDQLATAAELVARSIAAAIRRTADFFIFAVPSPALASRTGGGSSKAGEMAFELIASGGGVHNRAIMSRLEHHLPGAVLTPIESLGMVNAAKEALAFALLGAATLDGEPSNVPSATGASRRVILGSVTRT